MISDAAVSGIKLAYIGGGSREWAYKLMIDLALEGSLSGTVQLYDIDRGAALENEKMGNGLTARADVPGKWAYHVADSLAEALEGADFVIISILPGTFAEMASDVHAPEKYGIYQSVGDTTGPGGLVRALRAIPMYVEFAQALQKYSPDAWVINYTNPMALCVRTLYEVFPGIKAFGCCHEVFGTQELLAAMLAELEGIAGVARDEIKVDVLGINHFTWISQASYHGTDLFPLYRRFVDRHFQEGFRIPGDAGWTESVFHSAHRVKFDLFRRYGSIAAAGDRHLAEFMPPWYLKDPETVASWKFRLTPVDYRIERRKEIDKFRQRVVAGEEILDLKPSGEEGVRQIAALLGLGDLVTNVNLPNRGQIQGLPSGAVVETNALFRRDEIRPILAGGLPSEINGLVARHVLNQETVLRAALDKDPDLAFLAFLNDPLVTIGPDSARELFYAMLRNTRAYLPGWPIPA